MELNEESQKVVSLGRRLVMDNGLGMILFPYLTPSEQIKMQPLNKRMEHRICGLNMEPVQLAK